MTSTPLRPPTVRPSRRTRPTPTPSSASPRWVCSSEPQSVDPQAARAAAAADPDDVAAQILVADLDLFGGHVEDALARLIDTVRVTADADRNKAREHLVELFEVVGYRTSAWSGPASPS